MNILYENIFQKLEEYKNICKNSNISAEDAIESCINIVKDIIDNDKKEQ